MAAVWDDQVTHSLSGVASHQTIGTKPPHQAPPPCRLVAFRSTHTPLTTTLQSTNQYGDYDDDGAWGDAGAGQWECNLCKFKNSPFMPVCEICSLKKDAPAPEASLHYGGADTTHGVRPILLGEGVLSQHQAAYRGHPHIYEGEVRKLLDLAVAIPSANLPRIAATLAAEKSHDLVRALLDHMSIAEVLAFTKFLDGPRKVRQWTKKLERLSADPNRPVK
eukprot:CAMPEP_0119477058 /NCGR_PEP_ID=MMETSP1344-20130328/7344_1 /TAXON_ID=236787 /ORGANISM="Florenciella parvula, Strain CCMP2471" /LENGTH=219 /DNA_ID=CAMNT_0007510969 /DNA_START=58 /DNA_END=714 /DNA_ORIENTATION=-